MVVSENVFRQDMENILAEAMETGEPVILKTGLGHFFIVPEQEYMGMMGSMQETLSMEEAALFNMR